MKIASSLKSMPFEDKIYKSALFFAYAFAALAVAVLFFAKSSPLIERIVYAVSFLIWADLYLIVGFSLKKGIYEANIRREFNEIKSKHTTAVERHRSGIYPRDLDKYSNDKYIELVCCASCKMLLQDPLPTECPNCGKFFTSTSIYYDRLDDSNPSFIRER